jgi:hypothetical protein
MNTPREHHVPTMVCARYIGSDYQSYLGHAVENARSGGTFARHWLVRCASQNFLFDINIGEFVVAQRRDRSSRQLVNWDSEDELGRSITAQGGGAYARCVDYKTALPATAHISDSQATRTQTIAHSTETAECTLNTSMFRTLFHACTSLTHRPALSRIPALLRNSRPVQNPRRRQECIPRRHQEGLLRSCEEIPPRHQQGTHSQRQVCRRTVRIRGPLRCRKEEGI